MSRLLHTDHGTLFETRAIANTGRLYAILDACDAPAVPQMASGLGEDRAISLYVGTTHESYVDTGPYLAAVDSEVLNWILRTLWDEPWGVFVQSDVPLADLLVHLRKFVMVKSPEGEDWYFRYYDPRVLEKFLPTCRGDELRDFFGPVQAFGMADPETGGVNWIRRSEATANV